MECQRWPQKLIIWGRSGTQYDAMVTELLSSYCGKYLVQSYCEKSKICDTNWLRYLFSSYLNKIWLGVWHHHLANLHILKTRISLERKEIFEKSKQHFSSYTDYLFMFQNGLDRKEYPFKNKLFFLQCFVWFRVHSKKFPLGQQQGLDWVKAQIEWNSYNLYTANTLPCLQSCKLSFVLL